MISGRGASALCLREIRQPRHLMRRLCHHPLSAALVRHSTFSRLDPTPDQFTEARNRLTRPVAACPQPSVGTAAPRRGITQSNTTSILYLDHTCSRFCRSLLNHLVSLSSSQHPLSSLSLQVRNPSKPPSSYDRNDLRTGSQRFVPSRDPATPALDAPLMPSPPIRCSGTALHLFPP
ncbi:MAG: hypothetical protein A4E63_00401 [Syntrophorhabdus sp. PtaU1.Bin050]|nr:MAG: hypothetical protein A4E63_00401 [Syntrophorhabdus sp. PtaU1.Bin050]